MVGWTPGEAQILVALSQGAQALTHVVGRLDALNADIGSYHDLDLGLRRLIAADYAEATSRGFRLTRSGRALSRRGSKGIRSSRLLYQGIMRELLAAGAPPEPAPTQFSEQDYDEAIAQYQARMEPFVRWLALPWRQRIGHLFRRQP